MLKRLKLSSLWRPIGPSRTNTVKKSCPFHHRRLEGKSRKSRDTWSFRWICPWSTKWSRAKVNRVLSREHIGQSNHIFPTTQEITLHMDTTRWSTSESYWLYYLQPIMEKLCTVSKNETCRERERWQRNRMGRPLSPSQIPQKNISTLSKLHKTISVCWQRTSGNQKSRPLSSKTGRKKYKRRERRQRRWGGSSVLGREF